MVNMMSPRASPVSLSTYGGQWYRGRPVNTTVNKEVFEHTYTLPIAYIHVLLLAIVGPAVVFLKQITVLDQVGQVSRRHAVHRDVLRQVSVDDSTRWTREAVAGASAPVLAARARLEP